MKQQEYQQRQLTKQERVQALFETQKFTVVQIFNMLKRKITISLSTSSVPNILIHGAIAANYSDEEKVISSKPKKVLTLNSDSEEGSHTIVQSGKLNLQQQIKLVEIKFRGNHSIQIDYRKMEEKRYLEEEEKWLMVVAKKYFHLSQREISQRFGFYEGTVSKLWNKYSKQNNFHNNFNNCGRICEYNPQTLQKEIDAILSQNSYLSLDTIQQKLSQIKIHISKGSLVSIMKNLDYQKKSV
ncbi:hypothetical protein ABPG72_020025 [Tetrahymena utriculariae]